MELIRADNGSSQAHAAYKEREAALDAAQEALSTAEGHVNSSMQLLEGKQQKVAELRNAATDVDSLNAQVLTLETKVQEALQSEAAANATVQGLLAAAAAAKKQMVSSANNATRAAAAQATFAAAQAKVSAAKTALKHKTQQLQDVKAGLNYASATAAAKERLVYSTAANQATGDAEAAAEKALREAQTKLQASSNAATPAADTLIKLLGQEPQLAAAAAAVHEAVSKLVAAQLQLNTTLGGVKVKQEALHQAKARLAEKQAEWAASSAQLEKLQARISGHLLLANETAAAAVTSAQAAAGSTAVDATELQATLIKAAQQAAATAQEQLTQQQSVAREAEQVWEGAQQAADAAAQQLQDAQTAAGEMDVTYTAALAKVRWAREQYAATSAALKAAKERSMTLGAAVLSLTAVAKDLGLQPPL
ncbi:hypothetical protein COO60DRAFT_1210754 [Scenedesmus sp. NREL 46B-D3]|nr:hypothetical protein COO60DRAFT_1210754 [Scenedesmus sp. NREL 46B-D3]